VEEDNNAVFGGGWGRRELGTGKRGGEEGTIGRRKKRERGRASEKPVKGEEEKYRIDNSKILLRAPVEFCFQVGRKRKAKRRPR